MFHPFKETAYFCSNFNKERKMKKLLAMSLFCCLGLGALSAQEAAEESKGVKEASIVFDNTTQDLGTFSEDNPVVKCTFTFTNKGNAPLVIHQAIASCGCTVPTYTRMPVKPGEKGKLDVTYNGTGKFPGRFKKSITVRTNAKEQMVRLYITGKMTESEKEKK